MKTIGTHGTFMGRYQYFLLLSRNKIYASAEGDENDRYFKITTYFKIKDDMFSFFLSIFNIISEFFKLTIIYIYVSGIYVSSL